MFRTLVPDHLWVYETPLRFYGIELGRRMTVIRLTNGDLFVHSPAHLTPLVMAALSKLGRPCFFVCPNWLHDLWLEDPFTAFPEAQVYAPPAPWWWRRDLPFAGTLTGQPERPWSSEIDQVIFQGHAFIEEVVFFHPATRTIMLGDLCFNITEQYPPLTRLLAHLGDVYKHLAPTRDLRLTTWHRDAACWSVERILTWDFDRVIVGHGANVDSGGKAAFRAAFDWLLV